MNAEELFNRLNYRKTIDETDKASPIRMEYRHNIISKREQNGLKYYDQYNEYIAFNSDRTISTFTDNNQYVFTGMSMELLNAVNRQCEELGWIEE